MTGRIPTSCRPGEMDSTMRIKCAGENRKKEGPWNQKEKCGGLSSQDALEQGHHGPFQAHKVST